MPQHTHLSSSRERASSGKCSPPDGPPPPPLLPPLPGPLDPPPVPPVQVLHAPASTAGRAASEAAGCWLCLCRLRSGWQPWPLGCSGWLTAALALWLRRCLPAALRAGLSLWSAAAGAGPPCRWQGIAPDQAQISICSSAPPSTGQPRSCALSQSPGRARRASSRELGLLLCSQQAIIQADTRTLSCSRHECQSPRELALRNSQLYTTPC